MLKRTCIYLFIFISYQAYAINNFRGKSDTNKVSIKVIIRSKPSETEHSYKFSDQKNADTNSTKIALALPGQSSAKKQEQTKRIYISYIPERAFKNFKSQNSTINDPSKSVKRIFKNKDKIQKQEEKNQYKKACFLTSLLLLITGTLVCIFFRSGLPFIIAVSFLIGGYYVLAYTLLFI